MAEPLKIPCARCAATLRVTDARVVGKTIRCPRCRNGFVLAIPPVVGPTSGAASSDPDDDFLTALQSLPKSAGSADLKGSQGKVLLPPALPKPQRRRPGSNELPKPEGEPRRKRRKQNIEQLERRIIVGWILGGLIGGGIGAAIWAAIGHFGGIEIGWMALGVGALTGIGLHVGGQAYGDARSGWIAVAIAIFSIVLGRFVTLLLFMQDPLEVLDYALGFLFNPLGLLWCALAGFTAFRIGSGSQFD